MSFADHFSSVAKSYAAYRPRYPPELAASLAQLCAARELALEVGCGSGQLTASLAPQFARVLATEPSQAQLDAAPRIANVEYRCAPAEATGAPDASADLVVAAQAAHWFDWPAFVAETARVARTGALVALVSYGIVDLDGDAGAIVAHYYRETLRGYWPPERRHVENGYAELAWPWPPVAAPALAMRATWTRDELLGYVTTWSATVALVDRLGPAPFESLRADIARAWPGDEPREIRWPLTLKLARVG